jgi:integrase
LSELFDVWIATKDHLKAQSRDEYRRLWTKHGKSQLGALRVRELSTSRAERYIATLPTSRARMLRVVLVGMFATAVRYDVLAVNPIREVTRKSGKTAPARALTPEEFAVVRSAVLMYRERPGVSGPRPGRLLLEFIDVMASTGCRPNEVLGLRWSDVDLLADPPTMTADGTALDHGKVTGKGVHRQDERKGGAPAHTVVLPKLAVEALTGLFGNTADADGPVFANRDGGWMSLANLRRSLRSALPDELLWVTPYSFRRTVATVVRDDLGPAQAQYGQSTGFGAKVLNADRPLNCRCSSGADLCAPEGIRTPNLLIDSGVRDCPPMFVSTVGQQYVSEGPMASWCAVVRVRTPTFVRAK